MDQAHIYMVNTIFAVGVCLWALNWIRDLLIGRKRKSPSPARRDTAPLPNYGHTIIR